MALTKVRGGRGGGVSYMYIFKLLAKIVDFYAKV
jgi:hypothetical protein